MNKFVSSPEIWQKDTWLGIADSENTNQDFKTKAGILKLDTGKTFEASYCIEIENTNLSL